MQLVIMSRTENMVDWEKTPRKLVAKKALEKVVQQHQEQHKLLMSASPSIYNSKDRQVKQKKRNILQTAASSKKDRPAKKRLITKQLSATQCTHFATSKVVVNANEGFKKACPPGFKRVVVQRMSGKTQGQFDTYYVTPDNKVLRSKPEAAKYLANHSDLLLIEKIKAEDFEFGFRSRSFEVVTVAGGHQQVVTKSVSIQLTRCDDLLKELGILPTSDSEDSATEDAEVNTSEAHPVCNEDPNQSFHSSDSEAENSETSDSEDDRKDFSLLKGQWSVPVTSPYNLIYEQPSVSSDLWKIMTSAIIIENWKQAAFAYRFFELFDRDFVLASSTQIAQEILKDAAFPIDFILTYELIKKSTVSLIKAIHSDDSPPIECSPYVSDVISIFHLNNWEATSPTQFDLITFKQWLKDFKAEES